MAHTWKLAIGLGFLGAALAVGCTVKEGDGDDDGGAAGEGGTSGSGGTTGGSSGKGGTGSSAGKGGSSGAAGHTTGGSAGSATAGTGGTTGGSATAGTGGTSDGGMAGAGDTGGIDTTPTCDPEQGELESTPFPTCEADPSDDLCQVCIEESCCEESKTCYGTEPYNVCGWGGPSGAVTYGEIGCFQDCLFDKTEANEMTCTSEDADACADECATTVCFGGDGQAALTGNATNELAGCMMEHCASPCFGATTCD